MVPADGAVDVVGVYGYGGFGDKVHSILGMVCAGLGDGVGVFDFVGVIVDDKVLGDGVLQFSISV